MLAHYPCQRFFIELRLIIAIMVECVKGKGKRKDKVRKIEKRKNKEKEKRDKIRENHRRRAVVLWYSYLNFMTLYPFK